MVLCVGGLGLVTGVLYLWAVSREIAAGNAAAVGPLSGWTAFIAANTLSAGLLWWHRAHPLAVFAGILSVFAVSALAVGNDGNGGLTLPLWFGVYATAAYTPLRTSLIAVGLGWTVSAAVKLALVAARGVPVSVPEVGLVALDTGMFFVACFAIGVGFRLQRQRARAVRAEAVATERNRLARDLHDLAAHELMDALLSVRALRLDDDDAVLAEVEEKTSRALENMRAVVRTLREEGEDDPERASLADAAAGLIAAVSRERAIAVDSAIRVSVAVDDATASTTLSVLKEALHNAAAHAPECAVAVDLRADEDGVRLTVANPRPSSHGGHAPAGTGYGLIGAAERAALLDGSLTAGADPHGDWVVALELPSRAGAEASLVTEKTS